MLLDWIPNELLSPLFSKIFNHFCMSQPTFYESAHIDEWQIIIECYTILLGKKPQIIELGLSEYYLGFDGVKAAFERERREWKVEGICLKANSNICEGLVSFDGLGLTWFDVDEVRGLIEI